MHVGIEAEDACCPQPPDTTDAAHHRSIAGVVNAEVLEEEVSQEEENGRDKPDDDCLPWFYQLAVSRDGNEAVRYWSTTSSAMEA